MSEKRDVTALSLPVVRRDDAMGQFLRNADSAVDSAEWDVHCHEVAVERCEQELAKNQAKLAAAREKAEAARAVRDALAEKFDA